MRSGVKKILTLLLTLSLLFGLMATTVAYAAAGTENPSGSSQNSAETGEGSAVGDSVITGWIDIVSTENGVEVTLTPDREAIMGINKAQLQEILGKIIDEAKRLVIDEIKGQIIGATGPNLNPDDDLETEGITMDNLWMSALNAYIRENPDKFPGSTDHDSYIEFLKAAVGDDAIVIDFIDYSLKLLETALALGVIKVEQLPEAEQIEEKIITVFENKLNEYFEIAIDTYIDDYIQWMDDESYEYSFNEDVKSMIDREVKSHITAAVDNYINNGFVLPPQSPELDEAIADYFNAEIEEKLNTYIANYANGVANPAKMDELINETIDEWVSELVTAWPGAVSGNPISDYVNGEGAGRLDDEIDAKINEYMTSYFAGTLQDGVAKTKIEEIVDTILPEGIGASLEDQKEAWDNLDATDRSEHLAAIKAEVKSSDDVNDIISDYFADAENRKDAVQDIVGDAEILSELVNEAKTNESYKSFIIEEIDKYINDEENPDSIDKVMSTFREIYASISEDKKATIKDAIEERITEKANGEDVRAEAFDTILGITEDELKNVKVPHFAYLVNADNKYTTLCEEAAKETPKLTPQFLISKLVGLTINNNTVYRKGDVSIEALKALLAEIPTPSEIKDMANEDMRLGWLVEIETVFGVCDFRIDLILGGGYEYVRKLANVIASHFEFSINNGTVTVEVIIPDEFASALLKAAKSDRIPDSIKKKVFRILSASPDDAYALINDLSFDDIMTLLEHIDFERILDSKYVEKLEGIEEATRFRRDFLIKKLAAKGEKIEHLVTLANDKLEALLEKYYNFQELGDLRNEQILEKVAEYEAYYNKLIGYIKSAYNNYFPDVLKDKTIDSVYESDGVFGIEGSKTVDIRSIAYRIHEKYGPLLVSFIDRDEITVSVDAQVKFENINRVEYRDTADNVLSFGFLPVGADLSFFSGVKFINGLYVSGWQSEGTDISEMPDRDVVLKPVLVEPDIEIIGGGSKVYDGASMTLEVLVDYAHLVNPVYSYQWYYTDGNIVPGATSATLERVNVADSGEYYCVVRITDASISFDETLVSDSASVVITPKDISVSDIENIEWNYQEPIKYNGSEQSVLVDTDSLPAFVKVLADTYSNVGIVVGNYTATVQIAVTNPNYKIPEGYETISLDWQICKGVLDLGKLEWNYTSPIRYDGNEHTVELVSVGNVEFIYDGNKGTDVGNYTAKVVAYEINDDNYGEIKGGVENIPQCPWVITAAEFDTSGVIFNDKTVTYDGNAHSIAIAGLETIAG